MFQHVVKEGRELPSPKIRPMLESP